MVMSNNCLGGMRKLGGSYFLRKTRFLDPLACQQFYTCLFQMSWTNFGICGLLLSFCILLAGIFSFANDVHFACVVKHKFSNLSFCCNISAPRINTQATFNETNSNQFSSLFQIIWKTQKLKSGWNKTDTNIKNSSGKTFRKKML